MRQFNLVCLTLVLCSQLFGCETLGDWTEQQKEPTQPQIMPLTAKEYLQQAENATPPQKQQLQLDATRRYLQEEKIAEANRVINTVNTDKTPQYIHYEKALLKAKIALAEHKPREASNNLRPYRATSVVPELRHEYLDTFARAQAESNEIVDSIRLRNALSASLTNKAKLRANQFAIWHSIEHLPAAEITELLDSPIPPDVHAWLQLAQQIQQAGNDPNKRDAAIKSWQESNPNHPADQILSQLRTK